VAEVPTVAMCFKKGKEFGEALASLEKLSAVPHDELIGRMRPFTDLLGMDPDKLMLDWMMMYVDYLTPPSQCAPNWLDELRPVLEALADDILNRRLSNIKAHVRRIREIQQRIPPG